MEENLSHLDELAAKWLSAFTDELNIYHRYDRLLFLRLIYTLQRKPTEAMKMMAFWMWIEQRFGDFTLVREMVQMAQSNLKGIVDETILCFRCVESKDFQLARGEELFYLRDLLSGKVTYQYFHIHRGDVIEGVNKTLEETCRNLFADIIEKIFATAAARGGGEGSTSQQPPLSSPPLVDDFIQLPDIDVFFEPPIPADPEDDIHFPDVDVFFQPPSPPPQPRKSTLPASATPFYPASASTSTVSRKAPPPVPTAALTSVVPYTAPPFYPASASTSPLSRKAPPPVPTAALTLLVPYTAPPLTPEAVSTSTLLPTAKPFTPAAASTSVLPANAESFHPAAARASRPAEPFHPALAHRSRPTELIRCGFGPPSSEDGILDTAPVNGREIVALMDSIRERENSRIQSNYLIELRRAEALNNAVEQMLYLASDLGRQQQAAAVMSFPAMGMPFSTLVGHPMAGQWVPVLPVPMIDNAALHQRQMLMGHGGEVVAPPPEPVFLHDDWVSNYMERQVYHDADNRTIFITFSKGYPISQAEVYEFFTRKFGDIVEQIIMQTVHGDGQALFGKLVVRSPAAVDLVTQGGRAKYVLNGKHVMVRKYIKKGLAAAPSDVAGPSNA